MASFTEYVRLIAEGQEAIAVINKINEAIAKLRREASQPINVKLKADQEAAGEKKVRAEKKQTHDAEAAALKKRKEELAAIKAMNKEVGNPAHTIRYGNPQSILQFQRFNEQLSESTRRINRLADAHKHIRDTAKRAGVEVSPGLSERLAAQVVNRGERDEARAIRDAVNLEKARIREAASAEKQRIAAINTRSAQEQEAVRRVASMEKQRLDAVRTREKEETEAAKRVGQMEAERVRQVRERQAQEQEGARRLAQINAQSAREEKERLNAQHRAIREQERAEQRARRERETAIASARETGIRGVAGEFHRDIRRNMIYGAIGQGETALRTGYEANVARDTAIENLRQAGRTPEQIKVMEDAARKLSLQNPTITTTEMLAMQQHNIGAFGDFNKGMANNDLSARYLAIRKGKVGEEEALSENLAILKIGEETGRIRDGGWMKKLYDQQLKMAQAEGAQYDPKSLLTTVRMLKSTKFGLSDETMLNVLPFIGMGEGAARIGNQISMLQKSMIFAGKSLSKQNIAEISGTVLSDGKGGYNQELFKDVASGNLLKLSELMDKFYRQKGLDPTDKSAKNINEEMNVLAKAIGNSSAKEAIAVMTENREQIEKQQRMAAGAQGIYTPNTANRTVKGATDTVEAQYKNMSAELMKSTNPILVRMMNGIAVIEEQIGKGVQGKDTLNGLGALGAAGIFAALKSVQENPQAAMQTGLLTAIATNTAATAANTGLGALGGAAGAGIGLLSKAIVAAGAVTAVYEGAQASILAVNDIKQWWENHKLKNAAQTPEGIKKYNEDQLKTDQDAVDFARKQVAAHDEDMKKRMNGIVPPKGLVDQVGAQLAADLKAAENKLANDQKSPLVYKQSVADQINGKADGREGRGIKYDGSIGDGRYGRGIATYGPTTPVYHTDLGITDLPSASQTNSITQSTAKDAIAKINSAGNEAAGAMTSAGEQMKGGASAAAGSIAAGGEAVAGALNQAAAAIAAAGARAAAAGTPAVAPQATGQKERGNR